MRNIKRFYKVGDSDEEDEKNDLLIQRPRIPKALPIDFLNNFDTGSENI